MPSKLRFLKTEQEFSEFKKSRSLASANFRIRWLTPENQNTPRFGFIVPKKTVKKVTDRNLIKRRVKAVLSRRISGMRPASILFFPKPGSIKLKFEALDAEITGLFRKAGIYADTK